MVQSSGQLKVVDRVLGRDKMPNTVALGFKQDKGCRLHFDQIHRKVLKKLIHDVMSFFGFDTTFPTATNEQHQEEDLAVYTWGTEGYSNLGQALQEGRDEFNDETFGSSEAVGRTYSSGIDSPEQELTRTGMDFDFGNTVDLHAHQPKQSTQYTQQQHKTNHSIPGNTGNKPGKSRHHIFRRSFAGPLNLAYAIFSFLLVFYSRLVTGCGLVGPRIRFNPGCGARTPIFDRCRQALESCSPSCRFSLIENLL